MRSGRLLFAVVLVLISAGVAQANSLIDPGAIIKGGHGSFFIHGTTFSISAPTGTGFFVFKNANTFALTNLTLTFTPGGPSGPALFTCASQPGNSGIPAFTHCLYTQTGGPHSATVLKFFGGLGIKAGAEFGVELKGWPVNLTSQVQANTPEPATLSLVLLGACAAALRRKRFRV